MKISNEDVAILAMVLIFLAMANILPVKVPTKGYATSSANATITVTVVGLPPEILSYYPLIDPKITEEQNQTFNVSFMDSDDNELVIEWILDEEIVKEENKTVPWPEASNYTFVADYLSAGLHNVTVSVSDWGQSVQLIWELNVTNINRVPYFRTIPDIEWYEGSSHTMESLDNYAVDPDIEEGDVLSYEIIFIADPSKILARIDPISHEVFLRAITGFVGSEIVYFKVMDSYGAFNYSNNVTLTVKPIPEVIDISVGGGRGRSYEDVCENYWYCGSWGPCDRINSTRTRECIDLAGCPVGKNKPKEIESCTYIPTCYDKARNGDEVGIDCGGKCPPCWTCYDGIKNQDEEGIDCGGSCIDCPTCYDDKMNCQRLDKETVLCEKGVDCEGPCPKDCCENNYWDGNLGEGDVDCGGDCEPCEFLAPEGIWDRWRVFIFSIFVLVVVALGVSSVVLLMHRKKKIPAVMKGDFAFKDLRKMYDDIDRLEKVFDSVPNNKIIKLLLSVTAKIIYYRYHVSLSCTSEELLKKISNIKKDTVIRHALMHIYSRLYYLKYSGEEVSKEELLKYIKEVRVINYITLRKVYFQKTTRDKDKNPLLRVLNFVRNGAREDQIRSKLRHEHKEVKPEERKVKIIPVVFVVLILGMMFSLFVIPQQKIAKSGYSVEEDVIDESREVGIKGATLTRKEGSLLDRFVEWLIRSVRTRGMAPGDEAPRFVYLNDGDILTSEEDSNASFLIQATDDGDDDLIFSFAVADLYKEIFGIVPEDIPLNNGTSGWINFTPTEEYVYDDNTVKSEYIVTIIVKDSGGLSDSKYIIFNVTNVNDAPNITSFTPPSLTTSVYENKSITFSFDNDSRADPDLIHPGYDSITNEWYFDGVFNNSNVSWTYYPGFCDNGTYNVTLIVTDSYGLKGNVTWELEVIDLIRPPINNKSFVGYEYKEWVEGSDDVLNYLILEQFFEDTDAIECSEASNMTYGYETISLDSVDGSELNIVVDDVTSDVSFITPNDDWFGVHVIRFYGDNGAKAYSDVDIVLNVTNIADIPVLDFIPNQYAEVGYEYIYDVNATDADNDSLYFSDNATIFDIDESTGIINFTPSAEGTYSVNISVNDSMFTVSQIVNFTLYRTNWPPNITMIYPYGTPLSNTTVFAFNYTTFFTGDVTSINVTENTTMLFNHTSSDPEADTLRCLWYLDGVLKESYTCVNTPYWNYDVDFFQNGVRNITLVVDDGRLNRDIFTWNVSVKNINQDPTFGERILSSYSDFSGSVLNKTSITLELGSITLGKIDAVTYYSNGTYVSPVIDLKGHYARTYIKSISWKELKPSGTNITFRTRISNTAASISDVNWSDIYYGGSGEINSGGRYIQFKVNMTTDDDSITPTVREVTIDYEIKSMEITGNYQAWIDLDNFFDDRDGVETLNYDYEDIFASSILGLSINDDNIVSLYPSGSGNAIFRFMANDSYSTAYSNNITLDVNLETPPKTPIVITTSGGGGGGSQRRVKIVPIPEVEYEQLIYVEPLEVTANKTIIAPIILKNRGDRVLSDIYLGAKTDMADISFRFERDYISSLDVNEDARTMLYITQSGFINTSYSIDVIANVTEPRLQDISVININPLENITNRINLVMDLLQLHPVCRELEEVVVQAKEALENNRYEESYNLLTEVIDGCKYLVSAAEEKPGPRLPFVLRRKWIFILIAILVVVLLSAYFVPRIINKMRRPKLYEQHEQYEKN